MELGTSAGVFKLTLSKKKTITKKFEKMSEEKGKGLQSELGTLVVVLILTLSKKKQSPKKQYRKSGHI